MAVNTNKKTFAGGRGDTAAPEKKFLLVDDHAAVRRGVRHILGEVFPDASFGEASSAEEAEKIINHKPWDLVILDMSMPGRNGLAFLKDLKRTHPKLPVLMLSMHAENEYALRSLKAGASGYLSKVTAPGQLVEAVNKVLSGRMFVSDGLVEQLALALNPDRPRSWMDQLSNRELETLKLLAAGRTITDIGKQLGLSVKTISTYRTRMLEKLGMRTNSELLRFAIEEGLAG